MLKKISEIFGNSSKLQKQLIDAVERDDLSGVKEALEQGAKVDVPYEPGKYGWTALQKAVSCGHLDMVRFLVQEAKADPNETYDKASPLFCGDTPLFTAIQNRHLDVLCFLLLETDADPYKVDRRGDMPLHSAVSHVARSGLVDYKGMKVLTTLLDLGIETDLRNKHGKTALDYVKNSLPAVQKEITKSFKEKHYRSITTLQQEQLVDAVRRNDLQWVKKALEKGAEVNEHDKEGWTALVLAVDYGHLTLVKFLVSKAKADPNKEAKFWKNNGVTPVLAATQTRQMEMLRFLVLEAKADPNGVDNDGIAPVYVAVKEGFMDELRFLVLEAKADPNKAANDGTTPVFIAAQKKQMDALRFLVLEAKADPDKAANDGTTPVYKAAEKGHLEVLKFLVLEGKADPSEIDSNGATPFYVAAKNGHVDVLRFLVLEVKVDPNETDSDGATPFYVAAKNGHVDALHFLVQEAKVDPNAATKKDGFTPLHAVVLQCPPETQIKVLTALLKLGANPSLKDNKGNTALDYAETPEVKKLLIKAMKQPLVNPQPVLKAQLSPKASLTELGRLSISFEIPYSDLKLGEELGSGGFGVVYKAMYRFNEVAVKQLHVRTFTQETFQEFQNEMQIMANLHFPNVVQLYGVCTQQAPYCMVMEFMSGGSLFSRLHSKVEMTWPKRTSIAIDIAKGVDYLHSKSILHRDLKSLNVLLDKHDTAKLTDFGLSKVRAETASATKNESAGTLAWMAAELFKRKAVYVQKSDMYSYGMVLWELASRDTPFKDAQGNQALIAKWVGEGEREEIPKDTPAPMQELIRQCWEAEAEKRPSATQAVEVLLKTQGFFSQNANTKNPNLNLASEPSYRGNLDSQNPNQNSGPSYYNNFSAKN